MNRVSGVYLLAIAVFPVVAECAERTMLSDGWRFHRGEPVGSRRELMIPAVIDWLDDCGRELMSNPGESRRPKRGEPGRNAPFIASAFDDSSWREVRIPHDAAIEHTFSYDLQPYDGFLDGVGTVWYRYHFKGGNGGLTLSDGSSLPLHEGGRVLFECDGAMAYPMVWVNGRFAGGWPNGYMPWRVDITPFLKVDGENVIAVRLTRPHDYARWHTGLGLTRTCEMVSLPKDHIIPGSVFITTPRVSKEEALVHVEYEMSEGGRKSKEFTVAHPRLWDVDDPHLQTLELEGETFRYGIRSIEWTADDGFHLNGRRVQIRGFCFHQDLCSLGSIANRSAIRRRLEKAKAVGMNAVRMSHYPHSREWYDLCDEMGLLVMDEFTDAWELPKLEADYHVLFPRWHERDLRAMMRSHRNHPCIVLWSLGNEIWESRSGSWNWPIYGRNGRELVRIAHEEDPTRPTTAASDNKDVWRSAESQFPDVFGFNYKPQHYAEYHALNPGKPIVGTEVVCTQSSRGEYRFDFVGVSDGVRGLPSVRTYVDWKSNAFGFHTDGPADFEWACEDACPAVAGSFAWTAFDYFGAPGIMANRMDEPVYSDPVRRAAALAERERHGHFLDGIHSCGTGIFDLAGFAKDELWLYRARWMPEEPCVHILPHWNLSGREGKVTPVYVYSSGDEVELFVNGVSQGRSRREKGLWRFRFNDVVYQPGEVRAVAYRNGRKWAEEIIKTVGAPARVVVDPERAFILSDGEDVGYVTVKVVDADGNFCSTANIPVKVKVAGCGSFVAAENGDNTDFTWLRDPKRRTYNGLLSVLVRGEKGKSGLIRVSAEPQGLPPAFAEVMLCNPL